MLHIIWVILKIVGVLLAALVCLLLLLLCTTLLVPFCYRFSVMKDEKDFLGKGKVNWLFHMISVTVCFQNGKPEARMRILFFKKNLFPAKKQERSRKKRRKIPKEEESERREEQPVSYPAVYDSGTGGYREETEEKEAEFLHVRGKPQEEIPEPENGAGKKTFLERIRKIQKTIKDIPGKIEKRKESLKNTFQKGKELANLFLSDPMKRTLLRFKKHFLYLWRHLKPDKIWGELRYGLDDPALTGQLTGILYLILANGFYRVRLEPDFEHVVYEGELHVRGHIRLCHMASVAWKIFRDKEFRMILKKIQG